MTLDNTSNITTATGDGTTTTFSTVFKFYDADEIVVKVDGTIKTITTDYTVTGGEGEVGSVVFNSAPASSAAIVIERSVDYVQETNFRNFDGNPADVTEAQFDKTVMQTQQIQEKLTRALTVPSGTASFDGELAITDQGGKFLQLKSDLTGFTFASAIDTGTVNITTFGESLIAATDAPTARQVLLLPAQSASKRGAVLVQNDTDNGYEQVDSQGTSGQVLTSNGADALPSWQGKTGGSWKIIQTQTASASSSIDFTTSIDSTYDMYVFVISDLLMSNATALTVRTSTDAGSVWDSGISDYMYIYSGVDIQAGSVKSGQSTGDSRIFLTLAGTEAQSAHGTLYLSNPSSSVYTTLHGTSCASQQAGTDAQSARFFGARLSSGDVTGVRFLPLAGTLTTGRITLYGLAHS